MFHFRFMICNISCSQGCSSISFSFLFCSGVFCPVTNTSESESYCLPLLNTQCVKYRIFSLNHSNLSTVFLLPYLFLGLIGIKQISTNARSWGDMTLHEYKCIPLTHSIKCFLFRVMERKEIDIYWKLTVCQVLYKMLYIFVSIQESFFFFYSYHSSTAQNLLFWRMVFLSLKWFEKTEKINHVDLSGKKWGNMRNGSLGTEESNKCFFWASNFPV